MSTTHLIPRQDRTSRPTNLDMVTERRDDVVVIRLAGCIDENSAEELESMLLTQFDWASDLRRLVVDLGDVSMSAAGLDALLNVERRCLARSVRLCLVDCHESVLAALCAAGLGGHFCHYLDVAHAAAREHRVNDVAALFRLLPVAASFLRAIAAAERDLDPLDDRPSRWRPLSGEVTLAALYRVWDSLAEQLRPQVCPRCTDQVEPAGAPGTAATSGAVRVVPRRAGPEVPR